MCFLIFSIFDTIDVQMYGYLELDALQNIFLGKMCKNFIIRNEENVINHFIDGG